MPKRIKGVTERLLQCAKEEFLEKGYQSASIRDIAKKAGTSPRAVYTRFRDKEALFTALVEPAATELVELVSSGYVMSEKEHEKTQYPDLQSSTGWIHIINYMYDHIDVFKLIMECSSGTQYESYVNRFIDIDLSKGIDMKSAISVKAMNAEVILHNMLSKSFFSCLFEPIVAGMRRQEAVNYVEKLYLFYINGLRGIITKERRK